MVAYPTYGGQEEIVVWISWLRLRRSGEEEHLATFHLVSDAVLCYGVRLRIGAQVASVFNGIGIEPRYIAAFLNPVTATTLCQTAVHTPCSTPVKVYVTFAQIPPCFVHVGHVLCTQVGFLRPY